MLLDDRDDDLDISTGRADRGAEVPSYLVQAILVTLCCCQLFGIIAIVFAAQVSSHVARGDYAAARRASDQARLWCTLGFVGGLIANLIIGLLVILSEMHPRGF